MKIILWDFDGTLAYRKGGMWSAALFEVLQQAHLEKHGSVEQIRTFLQTGFPWHTPEKPHTEIRSAEEWWEQLFPIFERAFLGVGVSQSQAELLSRQVRRVYSDPTRWALFDDVLAVLEQVSVNWLNVLLTNHVPELPYILQELKIARFFARVFNSAETGYEKPHPRAFEMVKESFLACNTFWMVGDSMVADIGGATAVGIQGILVRRTDETTPYSYSNLLNLPLLLDNLS